MLHVWLESEMALRLAPSKKLVKSDFIPADIIVALLKSEGEPLKLTEFQLEVINTINGFILIAASSIAVITFSNITGKRVMVRIFAISVMTIPFDATIVAVMVTYFLSSPHPLPHPEPYRFRHNLYSSS